MCLYYIYSAASADAMRHSHVRSVTIESYDSHWFKDIEHFILYRASSKHLLGCMRARKCRSVFLPHSIQKDYKFKSALEVWRQRAVGF